MTKQYRNLVLAGTFDHFHNGHKYFLQTALQNSKAVCCGITTGWANKNKLLNKSIQNLPSRISAFNRFLTSHDYNNQVKLFYLNDPIGPAITNRFDAIAVTTDSINGAKLINKKRKKLHLKPLPIVLIDLINAQDHKKISSSRIRLGEINRTGLVYKNIFKTNKNLCLPQNKRYLFKQPIGTLFSGTFHNNNWALQKAVKWVKKNNPLFLATVGDIISQSLISKNIVPNLSVIDYRCQRQPITYNLHHKMLKQTDFVIKAKNAPGTISIKTIKLIQQSLPKIINSNQSGNIQITGEEDLLVLPLILLMPLNTVIFYGQPHKGIVKVTITENKKLSAFNLLKQFQIS